MRARVAASLGLALACSHAREAEDPSRTAAAASEEQPGAQGQAEPEAPAEEGQRAASEKGPVQKEGRVAGGSEDPGEVPVASSPGGLLKPGAEEAIRGKLGVKAGGMRQALQKFQKEHDLPATGIIDQRTAEALGLDPDEVFERASGQ